MATPIPKAADKESPTIQALTKKLVADGQAFYLVVEPVIGAIKNECFTNVQQVVGLLGGRIQYGWQIWETLPGVMAEAEFHAVWVDSAGVHHDITPKTFSEIRHILFLPDNTVVYCGRRIDNVRVPLQDDPLIIEYIRNAQCLIEVNGSGELVNQSGLIDQTSEMRFLIQDKGRLSRAIIEKYY